MAAAHVVDAHTVFASWPLAVASSGAKLSPARVAAVPPDAAPLPVVSDTAGADEVAMA